MPTLPEPELDRTALARRGRAFLACASAALGLAVLASSGAADAQQPPPPPPPTSTTAALPPGPPPSPPPAAAQPQGRAAPSPAQPPPAGAQPPPGYGAPPQGYGYPPQGYGYPPGYGPPPGGEAGQTPPGYGAPPQGYPYGYPYYPPYYGPPSPPPPKHERKSTGMMIGGIALTTAGIVGVLVGSGLASTAANQIDVYCEPPGGGGPFVCETRADETQQAAGIGVMIGGFVALAAGIPLWVIGSKRVPVKSDTPDANTPDKPATPAPAASMQLFVGPSSAAVRVTF
jgi:hypothetical protein